MRPRAKRPVQCDSPLAEGRPLSKPSQTRLRLFGFIGIKNRPSSGNGREFGGDAREFTKRRSEERRLKLLDEAASPRDGGSGPGVFCGDLEGLSVGTFW